MEIIILDGACMTDKEAAHAYIAKVMRFPAHYGKNLDALADCLSELTSRVTVILKDSGALRDNLGDYADRLIMVFEEMCTRPDSFDFVLKAD